MSVNDKISRMNRYDKRRKNTKLLTILLIVGLVLFIVLIFTLLFGNSKPSEDDSLIGQDGKEEITLKKTTPAKPTDKEIAVTDDETEDKDSSDDDAEDETKIEEAEPMDPNDENVKEAYKGDWKPVPTSQEEPHLTNFEQESTDWKEMIQAVELATGLSDMTIWWIGNGGEQKAIATVSPKEDHSLTYRVYLSWVTNEGWQPTLVESLLKNER